MAEKHSGVHLGRSDVRWGVAKYLSSVNAPAALMPFVNIIIHEQPICICDIKHWLIARLIDLM